MDLRDRLNLSLQEKGSEDSKVHLILDEPGVFMDEMFNGNEPVKSNSADARRKVSVIDSEDPSDINDALEEEINDSRKDFKELGVDILEYSDGEEPRSLKCFFGKETNGGLDKPEYKGGQRLQVHSKKHYLRSAQNDLRSTQHNHCSAQNGHRSAQNNDYAA